MQERLWRFRKNYDIIRQNILFSVKYLDKIRQNFYNVITVRFWWVNH